MLQQTRGQDVTRQEAWHTHGYQVTLEDEFQRRMCRHHMDPEGSGRPGYRLPAIEKPRNAVLEPWHR